VGRPSSSSSVNSLHASGFVKCAVVGDAATGRQHLTQRLLVALAVLPNLQRREVDPERPGADKQISQRAVCEAASLRAREAVADQFQIRNQLIDVGVRARRRHRHIPGSSLRAPQSLRDEPQLLTIRLDLGAALQFGGDLWQLVRIGPK